MTPNPQEPAQQPGWFKRNWYWVLGGGCLTMVLCCGGFGAFTYFTATAAVKNSVAYLEAVKEVTTNAEVQAALGSPVEVGMMRNVSFNEQNGAGTLEFEAPVSGSKGKGVLRGKSHKAGSSWEQDLLELELEGGKRIDVRGGSAKAEPPPPPARADDGQPGDKPEGDEPPAEPQGDAPPTK